ncbi:MAG: 3-ketoacyl-ACP reductase [Gammaproteobacteria bacterium]|nr:MAG: 3-ketoacyl-ACP reductase [Gammaproteobacteria bacterium]
MNKVAIVTGGSSGIGKAVCIALADAGFHLSIVGRTRCYIDSTLEQLKAPPQKHTKPSHIGLVLDVSNESDMQEMVTSTLDHFGRIDLLISSAGIGKKAGSERIIPHSTATLPPDEWEEVIGVNLTGTFLSNRAVLAVMMSQGSGHIINVCSSTTPHGLRGRPYAPAYSASKFGIVGLTESLAEEVATHGIRVQAIFPGAVETPLVDKTTLARPFGGAIAADNFAKSVMYLVTQSVDATIVHPHVIPFRGAFSNENDT